MPLMLATVLCIVSCGSESTPSSSQPVDTVESTSVETTAGRPAPQLTVVATVPEATSMNVASNGDDSPVVAWIEPEMAGLARVSLDASSLVDEVEIRGDFEPFTHPIERPGLAVRPDGTVDLAFTGLQASGGSVYYATFRGETPIPELISGAVRPETNLVHVGVGRSDQVALAWLEDSTLSVATSEDGGLPVEHESVDELTCDCCNPAPVFAGETLLVPFRDLEIVAGEVARDTVSIRSLDGGTTFEEPVAVADDHWFIDACPFSGPSAVAIGDTVVVAFMDARQNLHPDQRTSSIWVDVSHDGGATFGTDLLVSSEGINRWPVMGLDDDDSIHLVWELSGSSGGLLYSVSTDFGATFADPTVLLSREETNGSPRSPSVALHGGLLLVTWTDADGGHLGWVNLG